MATDEECMGHARESVRLAGLTDDQEIRDQLFALTRTGWPLRCTIATC